jgi:hypothetical protein
MGTQARAPDHVRDDDVSDRFRCLQVTCHAVQEESRPFVPPLSVGFGRIVASEKDAPNMSVNLVYKVDERQYKAAMRPSPTSPSLEDVVKKKALTAVPGGTLCTKP